MVNIITPTVGRIVWYYATTNIDPLAAIVCHVHNDRRVNLLVLSALAEPMPTMDVHLVQPGDEAQPSGNFATWMPYQIGQAAKHEEANNG